MVPAFITVARVAAFVAVASLLPAAHAELSEAGQAEIEASAAAVRSAARRGPTDVPVAGQASIRLPAGYAFVPRAESERFLQAIGNRLGPSFQGMIVDSTMKADWFATVEYVASGFIRDDDARDWNAEKLLEQVRDGTEETNASRRTRGIPEMEIVGWVQKPSYDAGAHRLVWSIAAKDKGTASTPDDTINYRTLALGREGYVAINLVTDQRSVAADRRHAQAVLEALQFDSGKRYADFNESTDRVAEYGLAALIAGAAAKKLGFFALAAAFLAKFWKVAIVAVAAGGWGALKKLVSRKPTTPQA